MTLSASNAVWRNCEDADTILGSRDFVVIMRRWRQRGPLRVAGAWTPVGVVNTRRLADTMAELLREAASDTETRVVGAHELLHKVRAEDRERILDQLHDRTSAAIQRDAALRTEAEERLRVNERRSGRDRRSGRERRSNLGSGPSNTERRAGADRRSGRDRRQPELGVIGV